VNTSRRWGHAIVCCLLVGFLPNPAALAHSQTSVDSRAMLSELLSARPTLRALLTVVAAKVSDEQLRALMKFVEQHQVDLDRDLRVSWRKDEIRFNGQRLKLLPDHRVSFGGRVLSVDPARTLDANVEQFFVLLAPPPKNRSVTELGVPSAEVSPKLATLALLSALVPTFFMTMESDDALAGMLLLALSVNHARTMPRVPMEGVRAASCNMADGSVNVELSDGMKLKVIPGEDSAIMQLVDRKGEPLGQDAFLTFMAPVLVNACKDSTNTFAKLTNRMRLAVTLAGASKLSFAPTTR
jgi:hypothetical protein